MSLLKLQSNIQVVIINQNRIIMILQGDTYFNLENSIFPIKDYGYLSHLILIKIHELALNILVNFR